MKRLMNLLVSLTLLSVNTVMAQSPSELFTDDYQGTARPFTASGFQNRWMETMLAKYDLSLDDLKTEELYSYFELTDELRVAFEEAFVSEDHVIFKLSILNNEKTDFETVMDLVRLFDTDIDEAALKAIHEEWLVGEKHYDTNQVGDHIVDTYNEAEGIGDAFIVRFTYPLEHFQNGEYPNLIGSLHDTNQTPPDLYAADEETDETVYVNRLYLNRLLDQISQDFGWALSDDHLKTNGGSVYYYPQELAEIGRVNEIYLFSGQSSRGELVEIRFTNDVVEGELPAFVHNQLNAYYFSYFAQLLQPELSQAEITEGYTAFLEQDTKEDFMLGELKIKRVGYAPNTFSLSRTLLLDDAVDYSTRVLASQEGQVNFSEGVRHAPTVEMVAPAELIYEKGALAIQLDNVNSARGQALVDKIQTLYDEQPAFGEQVRITGEILAWNASVLSLATAAGSHYTVHVAGEADLTVGDVIEVTGKNLGVQQAEDLNPTVIAESIHLNGQLIFRQGGTFND